MKNQLAELIELEVQESKHPKATEQVFRTVNNYLHEAFKQQSYYKNLEDFAQDVNASLVGDKGEE